MQNQELETIASFLSFVTPVVTELVTAALKSYRWQVKQEGQGLELVFLIKVDEKEIQFNLHNLLLEIATPDRDQQPLQFDEGLRDAGRRAVLDRTEARRRARAPLPG